MKRYTLYIYALLAFVSVRAQNPDLERLLGKYTDNPAIEYSDLSGTVPQGMDLHMAECLDFGDSIYLVRHFAEDYQRIKGFKKLKPGKILSISGNIFIKKALNKAITIRLWEQQDGYKDTVIEFDGCRYFIIHLGGYYEEKDIANFIKVTGKH